MLIELNNIKKYFPVKGAAFHIGRKCVRAVDNVDLTIKEGKNLGLVGESGSGKTTLGRIILKLYSANSGRIILDGKDITRLSDRKMRPLRKKVQMVFQDPYSSLDPRYTIRNILAEADRMANPRKGREGRMLNILSAVGLSSSSLYRFPHEFSGGERQRIAIARALIMNPRLLILDEAVSSLDVLIQQQIISLLKSLQKQYPVTYLFISHNLRVVKKLCHKIAVMYKGKIVELAQAEEIFQNPLHAYTKELLSSAIDYKARSEAIKIEFDDNSSLIDRGNGHFVID
jgi:ABC-type oligopeptide transport system ATPase subunit